MSARSKRRDLQVASAMRSMAAQVGSDLDHEEAGLVNVLRTIIAGYRSLHPDDPVTNQAADNIERRLKKVA